jgi:hypothetical protein
LGGALPQLARDVAHAHEARARDRAVHDEALEHRHAVAAPDPLADRPASVADARLVATMIAGEWVHGPHR